MQHCKISVFTAGLCHIPLPSCLQPVPALTRCSTRCWLHCGAQEATEKNPLETLMWFCLHLKASFKSKIFGTSQRKSDHLLRMQWMTAIARRGALGKTERWHLVFKNAAVSLHPPVSRRRGTSVTAGKLVCTLLVCSIGSTLPVSIRVPHQLHS